MVVAGWRGGEGFRMYDFSPWFLFLIFSLLEPVPAFVRTFDQIIVDEKLSSHGSSILNSLDMR